MIHDGLITLDAPYQRGASDLTSASQTTILNIETQILCGLTPRKYLSSIRFFAISIFPQSFLLCIAILMAMRFAFALMGSK